MQECVRERTRAHLDGVCTSLRCQVYIYGKVVQVGISKILKGAAGEKVRECC